MVTLNRFVWCGSINYHLTGLLDTIDSLYARYNALLNENGYGLKYDLGNAQMFVIKGMDKVRDVITKNRKRKLTKYKKLSNNTFSIGAFETPEEAVPDRRWIYVSSDCTDSFMVVPNERAWG